MTSAQLSGSYVLVEGKNDKHVIQNLCRQHGLTIIIQDPTERTKGSLEQVLSGGIAILLARVSARLKEPGLEVLGVVVDADLGMAARWDALRDRLIANGYRSVPTVPIRDGWVSSDTNLRRVGIWLMPDNQLPGILEDFVWTLLPAGDPLRLKAETIVSEIERESLNNYPSVQHPKALIHTWLAWQEIPGQPMGLAITAQALCHDSPTAIAFVAWLRRLFALGPTTEAI